MQQGKLIMVRPQTAKNRYTMTTLGFTTQMTEEQETHQQLRPQLSQDFKFFDKQKLVRDVQSAKSLKNSQFKEYLKTEGYVTKQEEQDLKNEKQLKIKQKLDQIKRRKYKVKQIRNDAEIYMSIKQDFTNTFQYNKASFASQQSKEGDHQTLSRIKNTSSSQYFAELRNYHQKLAQQKKGVTDYLSGKRVDRKLIEEGKTLEKPNKIKMMVQEMEGQGRKAPKSKEDSVNPRDLAKSRLIFELERENQGAIFRGKKEQYQNPLKQKMKLFFQDFLRQEKLYFDELKRTSQKKVDMFTNSLKLNQKFLTDYFDQPHEVFKTQQDMRINRDEGIVWLAQNTRKIQTQSQLFAYKNQVLSDHRENMYQTIQNSKVELEAPSTSRSPRNNNSKSYQKQESVLTDGSKVFSNNLAGLSSRSKLSLFLGLAKILLDNNLLEFSIDFEAVKDRIKYERTFQRQFKDLQTLSTQLNQVHNKFQEGENAAPEEKSFIDAIKNNEIDMVKALLAENPKLIQSRDYQYQGPLHWCAKRGLIDLIDFFLNQGLTLQDEDAQGKTAKDIARKFEQRDILKYLADREDRMRKIKLISKINNKKKIPFLNIEPTYHKLKKLILKHRYKIIKRKQ